jgi:hypothetical protein
MEAFRCTITRDWIRNPSANADRFQIRKKNEEFFKMSISNQEIVRKFVESKAIDFGAIGNLVTELGQALSTSDIGYRVVLAGRPFIIACLMPAADIRELVGELRNVNLKSAVSGE